MPKKTRPAPTRYEKRRTLFIRIVAVICALLILGSVLLSVMLT